jgi:hypothetical protein
MIKTEIIAGNALKITAPGKLYADDFRQIAPEVDTLINKHGKIRLLIDVSSFNGWNNVAALLNHIRFVKDHHQKVERIAVVGARNWQHWVIGVARMIIHPEVSAYEGTRKARRCGGSPDNQRELLN